MTIKNPYSMIQIKPTVKSEVSIDIKRLEKETILNLEHSKAPNTIREYQSDFSDFRLFCAKNGFRSIPSEPKVVSLYFLNKPFFSSLKPKGIAISSIIF